jgi:hypothetical protein
MCCKNRGIARRMERSFPATDRSTLKVDECIGRCELNTVQYQNELVDGFGRIGRKLRISVTDIYQTAICELFLIITVHFVVLILYLLLSKPFLES